MSDISYDQLISEFVDARVDSDDACWRQSAIAFFLKKQLGASGKTIASDTGYSEAHISNLIKTFGAYPEEEFRAKDKSFSLHMICAGTDDPKAWLDMAVMESWSVRQLKAAIKGDKPDKSELEIAEAILNKLVNFIEQDGEGVVWLKGQLKELSLI